MKIENVPVRPHARHSESMRKELIAALRDMKVGQSVVIEKCDSNTRTVVWCVNHCLVRRYGIRREPDGKFRIGRLE